MQPLHCYINKCIIHILCLQSDTPQTYTASIVTFDLSKVEEVAQAAEEILECHGYVDVLINNAGISFRGNILNTHISVHKEVMEINYFGPVALTQGLQEFYI